MGGSVKNLLSIVVCILFAVFMFAPNSFAITIKENNATIVPLPIMQHRVIAPQCDSPRLEVTRIESVQGRATRLRALVTRSGVPLSSRTVTFKVDNVDIGTATTNAAGIAIFSWTPIGLPRETQIVASLTPATCEQMVTASASASIAEPLVFETGKLGGKTSLVDIQMAKSGEAWVEPGILQAEITVRRSGFGAGTTARNGTARVSFAANGPGTPAPNPACQANGAWSCQPKPLYADAVNILLNNNLFAIYDRKLPPAMGGTTNFTTTTLARDYQDAWDQCALIAAVNMKTTWNHAASTYIPLRAGKMYQYTYPAQTVTTTADHRNNTNYVDTGAFRIRYLNVNIPTRVICSE
jgi:hypothetical protein